MECYMRFAGNADDMKADLLQPHLTNEELHQLLLESIGHWNVQEAKYRPNKAHLSGVFLMFGGRYFRMGESVWSTNWLWLPERWSSAVSSNGQVVGKGLLGFGRSYDWSTHPCKRWRLHRWMSKMATKTCKTLQKRLLVVDLAALRTFCRSSGLCSKRSQWWTLSAAFCKMTKSESLAGWALSVQLWQE